MRIFKEKKGFFAVVLFLAFPAFATHVAVLETTAASGVLKLEEKQYLTDVLRSEAVKALPAEQNYTIMTRENITAMLPPGKAIEDCEGSSLEETGKNISADYIAQGHVGRFANNLTITVELYETAGNKLMGSFSSKASNIESLEIEIRQKSFDLFSRIISSSYGKVDLKPALLKNVGAEDELVIKVDGEDKVDGRKIVRGVWEFAPGAHEIELSHPCYETQKFKVNVQSGKTLVVDNALDALRGSLSLSTVFNGKPRDVPVLVNGEMIGVTPMQGRVPLCAKVEVGDEGFREPILLDWAGKNNLVVAHKLRSAKPTADELRADSLAAAQQAAADAAAKDAAEKKNRATFTKPISITMMVLGVASLGAGLYKNMKVNDERKKYDDANYTSKSDFDKQWDKVESAQKMRNVFYGVGGGLLGAGALIFIVF